jgi:ribose 1,5-bisphosphokinase PhnN
MRHCSVQVRGLLTRDELDRYNALIDVGHFLEAEKRYDYVAVVQKEIDILILPAIERLKEKGRQRDRDTEAYLARKAHMEAELAAALRDDDDEE